LIQCFPTGDAGPLRVSPAYEVNSQADIDEHLKRVWARDGEGLIVKRRASLYFPGKRPKDAWIKLKQEDHVVMTITGFMAGKLGPYSTVKLRDTEGHETTVKTLNNILLDLIARDPGAVIGRKIIIAFQERTPDGLYRHPRWHPLDKKAEQWWAE
jgi:hypothetical protein